MLSFKISYTPMVVSRRKPQTGSGIGSLETTLHSMVRMGWPLIPRAVDPEGGTWSLPQAAKCSSTLVAFGIPFPYSSSRELFAVAG